MLPPNEPVLSYAPQSKERRELKDKIAEMAHKMGITTHLDGYPAETLGGLTIGVSPLEMAGAYSTLASGGVRHDPTAIEKVVFPNGDVDRPGRSKPVRVLTEAEAYEVTKILHDNITSGTGTGAYTGCGGQAGKTRTTDNQVDAGFVGYQPNLTAAAWIGYPQSNDISTGSDGGDVPASIWNSFFINAAEICLRNGDGFFAQGPNLHRSNGKVFTVSWWYKKFMYCNEVVLNDRENDYTLYAPTEFFAETRAHRARELRGGERLVPTQ